ncbi:pncA [Symbiodinium sp. CCMP2592]|nr:pncA [Symbiodinium sp. CCMP2592]
MEWLSAVPRLHSRRLRFTVNFLHLLAEAVEAVSSLWEAQPCSGARDSSEVSASAGCKAEPSPEKARASYSSSDGVRVAALAGCRAFHCLPRLRLVSEGLTERVPHLNSTANVACSASSSSASRHPATSARRAKHHPPLPPSPGRLSFSEEKHAGFFRGLMLLVQHGLLAKHTLRRVRHALFRTLPLGPAILLVHRVRDDTFDAMLASGELHLLAKGQHRARPEIPDNSHDALGYYIAALKRMALRLTREPDAHRAKCIAQCTRVKAASDGGGRRLCVGIVRGIEEDRVAGYEIRLPRLRHGRDRPPAVKESSRHWDALDVVSKCDLAVLRSQLLPKLAERLHCAWAQMAKAMHKDSSGALQAALTMEKDVLDLVIDLLGLRQPAVTQAVAELIVCGPLLSQLHVLAERHRYMNRPKSIWEIMMIDVENNGPLPAPERVDAMQAAEAEMACAADAEEDPPDQLAAVLAVRSLARFLQKMQTERVSGVLVPLIQLLLWPAVPAALAESKGPANSDKTRAAVQALGELCTACGVEEAALATSEVSAQQRLSERQIWLRDCTGADLLGKEKGISNPFRGAIQAMLDDQSIMGVSGLDNGFGRCCWADSTESMVPCAVVASYLLRQCQATHPTLLHDSGLLLNKADVAEPSVKYCEI